MVCTESFLDPVPTVTLVTVTDYEIEEDPDAIGQCTLVVAKDGSLSRVPGTVASNQPLTPGVNKRPPRATRGYPMLFDEPGETYRIKRREKTCAVRAIVAGSGITMPPGVKVTEPIREARSLEVLALVAEDPDPRDVGLVERTPGLIGGAVILAWFMVWAILVLPGVASLEAIIPRILIFVGGAALVVGLVVVRMMLTRLGERQQALLARKAASRYEVPLYLTLKEALGDWGFSYPEGIKVP